MQRFKSVVVISIFFLLTTKTVAQQPSDDKLKSRAELTNYEETTRYEEVLTFIAELQKRSSLIRLESFGKSEEGRSLPLMILSDSPISNPRDARGAGKPIVFIMANIHAGEVEGKEAMLHLSRRLLFGDLKPLLNKLHGQKRPAEFGEAKYQFVNDKSRLLGTKRTFKKYGKSGIDVSDLFPHTAACVDDLAVAVQHAAERS